MRAFTLPVIGPEEDTTLGERVLAALLTTPSSTPVLLSSLGCEDPLVAIYQAQVGRQEV